MKATIPHIRVDIPIWVVFRALGVISDRDVSEHICYDVQDTRMLEMLKPCIDDGFVIQDREAALDFIGNRGTTTFQGTAYQIRARDCAEGDVTAHFDVRRVRIQESLLLWKRLGRSWHLRSKSRFPIKRKRCFILLHARPISLLGNRFGMPSL